MRVCVTGAGGGLGRALLAALGRDVEAVAFAHADLRVEERDLVLQRIGEARPDAVFHLAAKTGVDDCERDPGEAHQVNAVGTANVADAAREAGALLVHVSTDYVFDGEKEGPYVESDRPNPISAYGRSKLAGEEEARARAPELVIVRSGWLFGSGGDFATGALRDLASGLPVGAVVDRTGTPTYAPHLAERLLPLATSGLRGIVHLAGPEPTTWFDVLARARAIGRLPGEVTEQKTEDLGLPAPRPANSALASEILPVPEVPPMPPLDAALRQLLERIMQARVGNARSEG